MLTRIITAIIALLLFVPVLFFSHTFVFDLVIAIISLIGTFELLKCVNIMQKYIISVPSLFVAFIVPLLVRYVDNKAIVLVVIAYMFWLLHSSVFSRREHPTSTISLAFFCTVYVTISFTSILITRNLPNGEIIYLMIFIGAWSTDTFAYFVGKLFGKHKLIPQVSPKKTVEGALGGIIFCSLAFILYGYIVLHVLKNQNFNAEPNYIILGVVGIITSIIAQLGDLSASAIKRNYYTDDFGTMFPGHGGILDRFDSVMAVAPVIMLIVSILLKFERFDLFR